MQVRKRESVNNQGSCMTSAREKCIAIYYGPRREGICEEKVEVAIHAE